MGAEKTVIEEEKKPSLWTRRNKVLISIILVCVVVVIIAGIALQFQYAGEKEIVEDVIRKYCDSLNLYDVDAGWELMSPTFREDVGYTSYERFMRDYWEAGEHHVEIQEITDKRFLLAEILRTWEFTLNWQLTNTTGTYTEEVIFQVERIEGNWRILDWGYYYEE